MFRFSLLSNPQPIISVVVVVIIIFFFYSDKWRHQRWKKDGLYEGLNEICMWVRNAHACTSYDFPFRSRHFYTFTCRCACARAWMHICVYPVEIQRICRCVFVWCNDPFQTGLIFVVVVVLGGGGVASWGRGGHLFSV